MSWTAASPRGRRRYPLFPSSNVPSKAFAEIVEHDYGDAGDYRRRTRPPPPRRREDHRARQPPARRIRALSRAGRGHLSRRRIGPSLRRSGARARRAGRGLLRRAHPRHHRRAVAIDRRGAEPGHVIEGGTQAWRLAGLDLEHGPTTALRPASPAAIAAAQRRAATVAARFGVRSIDRATLAAWQSEAERRTTYLLDVRTPEEFAAGHLPGSVSAPGGQLVQAIDRWVGDARRPPRADRRCRRPRGDDRAMADADGLGRLRARSAVRRAEADDRQLRAWHRPPFPMC